MTETSNDNVIDQLSTFDLQTLQQRMGNKVLIIKFGAEWCGPCKRIAPTFHAFIKSQPENIIFADIDVDENIDIYMALKRNKMISAVPVFLAYYGDNKKREKWFIPDDSLIGADETQVKQFFQRCLDKASKINEKGYSYYS
jgi:thiol-disulfide isomerase/thioredoxin